MRMLANNHDKKIIQFLKNNTIPRYYRLMAMKRSNGPILIRKQSPTQMVLYPLQFGLFFSCKNGVLCSRAGRQLCQSTLGARQVAYSWFIRASSQKTAVYWEWEPMKNRNVACHKTQKG